MRYVPNTTHNVPDTLLRRGDVVKVAMAGGSTAERVVWNATDEYVHVCNRESYARLLRGEPAAQPIAFPRLDVDALEEVHATAA